MRDVETIARHIVAGLETQREIRVTILDDTIRHAVMARVQELLSQKNCGISHTT